VPIAFAGHITLKAKGLDPKFSDDPGQNLCYYGRGTAYLEIGKKEEALADANTFIDKAKTNALGYDLRGRIYKAMGKTKEADEDMKKAASLKKEAEENMKKTTSPEK